MNMDHVSEIKNRLRIDELVHKMGLEVIRIGSSLFIKSIYKEDKNPSLCLYPKQNRFYDYSTDKQGDLVDLFKDYYNISFQRAIEELCIMTGIEYQGQHTPTEKPLPPSIPEKPLDKAFDSGIVDCLSYDEKKQFLSNVNDLLGFKSDELIQLTPDNLHKIKAAENEAKKPIQLARLEQNKAIFLELYCYCKLKGFNQSALLYLTEERKLDYKKLQEFKVFTIDNYNEVNNHMKKHFPLEVLQRSGLYNKKPDGSGNLIFFQHRIIIPYLYKNEIVYLRGRYFDNNNSPNTDKNKYIGLGNDALGLNATKRFFNIDGLSKMLKGEKVYLVEGEFDCIALETIGFNALCIPGARNIPPAARFKQLLPYEVCLCVDNDEAGKELKTELGKIFSKMNKTYSVKILPSKDVNDFLKKEA